MENRKLYYEILGDQQEYLVMLHGFMENSSIWSEMEAILLQRYTLIKIDLPGHGKSPVYHETHSMEFMAEKVHEIIREIGVAEFNLLGHSMGGYVALAFAERYVEMLNNLCLFFSTPLADTEEKKQTRQRSLPLIEQNFTSFVQHSIPNLFDPEKLKVLENQIGKAKEIALSTSKQGVIAAVKGMMERKDRVEILEGFKNQVVIIAGKSDQAVNTSEMIKKLPDNENFTLHVLDCGHNGHWELPEKCAKIITEMK